MGKSNNWKETAEWLFFEWKDSIEAIAKWTGISRRSISAHLNTLSHYKAEREKRKLKNQDRTEYWRKYKCKEICEEYLNEEPWDAPPFSGDYDEMGAVLKRRHREAACTLSYDASTLRP